MIKVQTQSKLNIGYQIFDKRQDSIFNFSSFQIKLPIGDTIEIEESNQLDIRIIPQTFSETIKKTIIKTLTVFTNYYCIEKIRAKITINKRIPMNSGLGSRASLASALLKGLTELTGKSFHFGDIESLAILIDEDIEFFMAENNALLIQKGLTIMNLDILNPYYTIVVIPDYETDFKKIAPILTNPELEKESLEFPLDLFSNTSDLTLSKEYFNPNYIEEQIFTICPVLKEVKYSLISLGALYSVLNNKGSSVFGLFDDITLFRKACDEMKKYRMYIYEPE